jgi:acetyl-CoA synthase
MGGITLEDVVILSAHGAKKIVSESEELLKKAISENGENQKISFPDTAYYLPLSYALFGFEIKTLKDIYFSLNTAISIINKKQSEPLKYVLDNGVATLLAEEIITAIRYLYNQEPQPDCEGFFSDTIMRTLGIQLVDGRLSGFAAILGAAPDNNTAVEIVRELQKRQILVFLGSSVNGKSIIDQLKQENVEMGWETYVVPYGRDTISLIYPLNWAIRAALTFGGIKPGDTEQIIKYCKERIFAFAIALGALDEEKVATGAGAINVGIPIIADTDIPEIPQVLVKQFDHKKIVQTAVDVRGIKVRVREVDIPVPFSSAFEGERVRKEQTFVEFGSKYSKSFELLITKNLDEVEDGKIELIGPDIDQMGYTLDSSELPFAMPLGIIVEVAGKKMQKDYESIIERQIHHYLNFAMGIFHMGQRDQNWIRISKQAFKSGFRLKHLGKILHFGLHEHFPALIDKLQIKIITDEPKVVKFLEEARKIYEERDERIAGLTDEAVDTFYSCTLCQSYAPNHVCVITPEKLGLCGAYNWFDGKVAYEINPKGMNQPIPKGRCIDPVKGEWEGVNEFVYKYSNRAVERFFNYSIMEYPTTSCGCFECIIAIIPECNGFMVVNRGYTGMTPVGMTFSTLAGSVGGGNQTPGFLGVGRLYLLSKKFLVPEGGLRRIVWMTKELKEFLGDKLKKRCEEIGEPDLVDKIADETITTDSVQLLEYLTKVNHPALSLPPLI